MTGRAERTLKRRFAKAFDRLAGLPTDDEEFCAALLDTTMLRPVGLATASAGFLLMSFAAVVLDGRPWTIAWLAADVAFLIARLIPAILASRDDVPTPPILARVVVSAAFVMFTTFGMGCAVSFASGIKDLQIASTIATMGLLAGLATRWAAIPRLVTTLYLLISVLMASVITLVSLFAGALFVILGIGTIVLTLQNNRTLLGMLRAERRARTLANTDPLTNVLNRAGLNAAMEALAGETVDEVAILYMDLDGFKRVNDCFGHAAGDTVLKVTATRIAGLQEAHCMARIGGDEFVLVLMGAIARTPHAYVGLITDIVEQPIVVHAADGRQAEVHVGASVGWAVGSLQSQSPADLLEAADRRLYVAKRNEWSARHRSDAGAVGPPSPFRSGDSKFKISA